ncbi:MAG TPA: thiamine pyrophosphate-dependent enzyme [Ilumatobacteraceae bacterium]|nr:thiamine pyrophosphate-dependent enzyme [Ilumatobacteraceae bacterium]HRB04650.1 thiamine pyrophosphate-dependent enzyme [Ilumatobacteraceae bacterium]
MGTVERSALEAQLFDSLCALDSPPMVADAPKHASLAELERLFDVQLASRHCDLAARWLRGKAKGYYTIGSAGHESNAAVAMALHPTDPALLHYRSGGFYLARAGLGGVHDILAGMVAAVDEPIAGGRHKVFGRHDLAIIPQTSTIASHLPRAVGVAFAIGRAARLGVDSPWPRDALAVCSFGDASANHSVAAGAINTALNCAHQRLALPLLFVCEDNGLGISVRTPAGWIESAYGNRTHLRYVSVDGSDPEAVLAATAELGDWVRSRRRPGFLHLRTVRFGGHAGTDVESAYRTPAELRADAERDPILATARRLIASGQHSAASLAARHDVIRARVFEVAATVAEWPQLATAAEVLVPLAPRTPAAVAAAVRDAPVSAGGAPVTLAQSINATLGELLKEHSNMLLFGEDVAAKGGVYGVTKGLLALTGGARVFDTLLDETSILGLALGTAISGFLPIAEIQYLAYLHNAEDQLRGEAATLQFFSNGKYRNGMVVRIAGLGYQEGFGGHFHNDDSVTVLRDLPGVVVAVPARPDDGAAILRTLVAAAEVDGTVGVIVEPIARYHTADLMEPGDRLWLATPDAQAHVPIGSARTYGDGKDITIITFGNGLFMSLRVARRLQARGTYARVVDMRWIAPLPVDDIVREANATGAVLVVDETRRSGGVAEGVLAALIDGDFSGRMARVTSKDSFIPLGEAAKLMLLSEPEIEAAVDRLLGLHE